MNWTQFLIGLLMPCAGGLILVIVFGALMVLDVSPPPTPSLSLVIGFIFGLGFLLIGLELFFSWLHQ
jgi:hypothetical protein